VVSKGGENGEVSEGVVEEDRVDEVGRGWRWIGRVLERMSRGSNRRREKGE